MTTKRKGAVTVYGRQMPVGSTFSLDIDQDGIAITFDGRPVLVWDFTEIEEAKETGAAVSEAIRQAYQNPKELYEFLWEKKKLPGQERF